MLSPRLISLPPPDLESVALDAARLFSAGDHRKRSSDDNKQIRAADNCSSPNKKKTIRPRISFSPRDDVVISSPTERADPESPPATIPAVTPSPAEALANELALAAEKSAERRNRRAAAARARCQEEYLEAVRTGKRKRWHRSLHGSRR